MTVEPHNGGGAVAGYDEDFGNLGLEDVGASDLLIPRININHDDAVFVNSLTKEEFPALTAVFLGLVKQRIMWPSKLEEDSKPQCKSPDNTHGFPNMDESQPKRNQFPWARSNFEPTQAKVIEIEPSSTYPQGWSSNGHPTLPCEACTFAKWGKDEDNRSVPPPCSEQHTYPILYMQEGAEGETLWIPALFTVQRSAIKNSRAYINGFAQSRQPFFTVYTGLTLRHESRGGNEYAVPEFKKMGPSDRNQWGEYANQLRSIREFIRSAPRPKEETDESAAAPTSNENTAPAESQPAAPAPEAAAPAAPPTPPPAPPAPQPPTPPSNPTPPQPQATSPTPPAPPAPPAAPPAPPAAPPSAPPSSDNSDLPF